MKLNEIANQYNPDISAWFEEHTDATRSLTDANGLTTLHSKDFFVVMTPDVTEIPYPIKRIEDGELNYLTSLMISGNSQLRSVKNLPRESDRIDLGSSRVASLEGLDIDKCDVLDLTYCPFKSVKDLFPHICCDLGELSFGHPNITSLVGVHEGLEKNIEELNLYHYGDIKEGGLGLLLIPGLKEIKIDKQFADADSFWPLSIIAKFAGRPDDIFECQAKLIELGYEEFAKL